MKPLDQFEKKKQMLFIKKVRLTVLVVVALVLFLKYSIDLFFYLFDFADFLKGGN